MASSCRQKILIALSKVGQTHVMDLVRRVNSTYGRVNRNLQILEHKGIVNTRYYGRLRMIKLNRENPKTVTLLKALRLLRTKVQLTYPIACTRINAKNSNVRFNTPASGDIPRKVGYHATKR